MDSQKIFRLKKREIVVGVWRCFGVMAQRTRSLLWKEAGVRIGGWRKEEEKAARGAEEDIVSVHGKPIKRRFHEWLQSTCKIAQEEDQEEQEEKEGR